MVEKDALLMIVRIPVNSRKAMATIGVVHFHGYAGENV